MVLAVFENRNAAERMLRSLGREFRQKAHSGDAAALVISGNADGSLKLTQSRVVTASGVGAAVAGVSVAMMAGLLGTLSALKGAKTVTSAAHTRASHVGVRSGRRRSSLRLASEQPSHSFAVRIQRYGRRRSGKRPSAQAPAGMAR